MPLSLQQTAEIGAYGVHIHSDSSDQRQECINAIDKGENPSTDTARLMGSWLKGAGDAVVGEIIMRAEILGRYDDFSESVQALAASIKLHPRPQDHPSFVKDGAYSNVFRLNHNGKDYAVRMPNGQTEQSNAMYVEWYVSDLVRGVGARGLEQIVTANHQEGVVISEFVDAKPYRESACSGVHWLRIGDFVGLMNTYEEMSRRGLEPDTFGQGNLLLNENGFTVIDYIRAHKRVSAAEMLEKSLFTFLEVMYQSGAHEYPLPESQKRDLVLIANAFFTRYPHLRLGYQELQVRSRLKIYGVDW